LIVRDFMPCADHEIPLFVHQMQGAAPGCQFQSPTLGLGQSFSPSHREGVSNTTA
jgi:hypothetical protein